LLWNAVLGSSAEVVGLVRNAFGEAVVVGWFWHTGWCSDAEVVILVWLALLG
jgi:hypothetical protein